MTLSKARVVAKGILERVAAGEDPQQEWSSVRGEPTIRELFEIVYKEHWDTERYRKSGWAKDVKNFFDHHIDQPLGAMKIGEVTPKVVRDWHKRFSKMKPTGNRSLEVLSKMYSFAAAEELTTMSNPCKLVKPFPEKKRSRFATPEEIKRISERLDFYFETFPYHSLFIYLVLHTGCRPSTLQRATHSNLKRVLIDGEEFGIVSFDGKSTAETGEAETVVIPPHALKKLDSLTPVGDRLVPVNFVHGLWEKIRSDLGIHDLWLRDLRRTFATVGLSQGESLGTIGEILNHKSTQTTKIYAKLLEDSRFKAVKSISDSIVSIGKPVLKVV